MEDDVASHVADTAHMTLAPEIVTRRATVKARKGETVASIARRYSLSAASVAEWNKVSAASHFKTGQAVVVFLPVKSQPIVKSSARSSHIKAVKRSAAKPIVKTKKR